MNPIVRVEGLSKHYHLGTRDTGYDTLRESIVGSVRGSLDWLRGRNGKSNREQIWALKT